MVRKTCQTIFYSCQQSSHKCTANLSEHLRKHGRFPYVTNRTTTVNRNGDAQDKASECAERAHRDQRHGFIVCSAHRHGSFVVSMRRCHLGVHPRGADVRSVPHGERVGVALSSACSSCLQAGLPRALYPTTFSTGTNVLRASWFMLNARTYIRQ